MLLTLAALLELVTQTRADYLAGALLGRSERRWPHSWNDRPSAGRTLGAAGTKSRLMLLTLAALLERGTKTRAKCLAGALLGRSERCWPLSWNDRRGAGRTLGADDTRSRFMLLTLATLLERGTEKQAKCLAGAFLGRSELAALSERPTRRWPHSWSGRHEVAIHVADASHTLGACDETRVDYLASALLGCSERCWPHFWNDRRGAGSTLGAGDTKSRFMLLTLAALVERVTEMCAECLASAFLGRSERRWPHSWNDRRGASRTLGAADTTSRFMLLTLAALLELVTQTRAAYLAGALLGLSERRWPHSWNDRRGAGRTLGAADTKSRLVLLTLAALLERGTETRAKCLAGALLGRSERCWPHSWNDRRGAGRTIGAADTKSRFMLLTLAALLELVTQTRAAYLAGALLGLSERRWPHSWNDRRDAGRTLGAADTKSRLVLLTLAALLERGTETRAKCLAGALLGRSERCWPHSWNDRRGAVRIIGAADTKSRFMLLTLAALVERVTEMRAECLASAFLGRSERRWPHSWNDRRGAGRTLGAADTKSRLMLLTLAALSELVTQMRADYLAGALLGRSERRWPHSWNDRRGAGRTLGAADTKSRLMLLTLAALLERGTETRTECLASAFLGRSERRWPHSWNDRRGAGRTIGAADTKSRFMLLTLAALLELVTQTRAAYLAGALLGLSERRWPHSWNDRRGAGRTLGAADTKSRLVLLTLAALLERGTETRAKCLAGALLGRSERCWPHSWNDRRGAGRIIEAGDTMSRFMFLTLAALLELVTQTRAKCLAGALLGRSERRWPLSWNDRRGAGRTLGADDTRVAIHVADASHTLGTCDETRVDYLAGALLGCSERLWPHSWNDRRGAGRTLGAADTTSRFMLLTLAALVERVTEMRAECLASAFLGRSERRWPHSWNNRRGAGRTLGAADTTSRFMLLTLAALLELVTQTRADYLAGALLGRSERRWPHSWNDRPGAGRTLEAADTKSRFMLLTLAALLERGTETRAECLASAFLGRSERRWPHSWNDCRGAGRTLEAADTKSRFMLLTLAALLELVTQTRAECLASAFLGRSERRWLHSWNDRRGGGHTLGAGDTMSRFMFLTLAALLERGTETRTECLASAFLGRSERRWPHSWNDRRGAGRTIGAADTKSRFMLLTLAALLELVTQTRAAYLAGALLGLSERRWPHSWNDRRGAGRTLGAADTKSRLVLLTLAALLERGTETRAKCLAGALLGRSERCWPHSWNDRRGAGRIIGAGDTMSRFMFLTLAALLELVTQTRAKCLAGALLGRSERRWPLSWNDRRGAGRTLGADDTRSRFMLLTLATLLELVTKRA